MARRIVQNMGPARSAARDAARLARTRPSSNSASIILDDALELTRWQAIEGGAARGSGPVEGSA